jgi:ferric-dicitrate binding protein FerR (iron transport regulator)
MDVSVTGTPARAHVRIGDGEAVVVSAAATADGFVLTTAGGVHPG